MKLVYTEEALAGLQEVLDFIAAKVTDEKLAEIRDRIVNKADILLDNPFIGQEEEYLDHNNGYGCALFFVILFRHLLYFY